MLASVLSRFLPNSASFTSTAEMPSPAGTEQAPVQATASDAVEDTGGESSALIQFSASARSNPEQQAGAAVFAEIWRGGSKVAVVDANGNVSSLTGVPIPLMSDSGGGPTAAAYRAAQIASMIGGEVRANGQAVTPLILMKQASLQKLYGSAGPGHSF